MFCNHVEQKPRKSALLRLQLVLTSQGSQVQSLPRPPPKTPETIGFRGFCLGFTEGSAGTYVPGRSPGGRGGADVHAVDWRSGRASGASLPGARLLIGTCTRRATKVPSNVDSGCKLADRCCPTQNGHVKFSAGYCPTAITSILQFNTNLIEIDQKNVARPSIWAGSAVSVEDEMHPIMPNSALALLPR